MGWVLGWWYSLQTGMVCSRLLTSCRCRCRCRSALMHVSSAVEHRAVEIGSRSQSLHSVCCTGWEPEARERRGGLWRKVLRRAVLAAGQRESFSSAFAPRHLLVLRADYISVMYISVFHRYVIVIYEFSTLRTSLNLGVPAGSFTIDLLAHLGRR